MLNNITIMGRLVKDPELKMTNNGIAVTSFAIACERDFAEGGEKITDFIDITAWRTTAEFISKYFSKGSMIAINGRLQIRTWVDQNGNNRKNAEVVADKVYFAESKKADKGEDRFNEQKFIELTDEDDLPF